MAAAVDAARAAEIRSALQAFSEAHNVRDWERLRSSLIDGFRFADHRPTGFGEEVGADAYVHLLKLAIDLVPDRTISLMESIPGAPAEVLHFRATGTDEFGGTVDWDFLAVWDVQEGLLTSLEVFTIDALDAAVQRAEDLFS